MNHCRFRTSNGGSEFCQDTAYLEGFYHRPRMDKDLLAEHAEGVICLSGCLSSELSTLLLAGQDRRAEEAAGRYRDIFGSDEMTFSKTKHLGSNRARLSQIQNGKWTPITDYITE